MPKLTQPPARRTAVLLALAGAAACTRARPVIDGQTRCVSWKDEIAPLLAAQCGSCHGGATPAAGYDTGSYLGVLGGGSDGVPDAVAGDPASQLLRTVDPATADATHQPVAGVFPELQQWVVDCQLSYVRSSIHRAGILDPASADFHGPLVRQQNYQFTVCAKCHGDDFAGGTSGVSCKTCHAGGPTACETCHGDIATSGSHGRHLGGGPLHKAFDCSECHVKPAAYTDVGHILLADGTLDPPPAEVKLGAAAALSPDGATRAGPPAYDTASGTCSNVYCHGALLGDSAATITAPSWRAPGTGQADCGTCHGLPPNHANSDNCAACHAAVVARDRSFVAPDLHIDGKVELGAAAAGCSGCHGSPQSPAPPRDLSGASATTALGVGAHQAHLQAPSGLRGPIACNECHLVPADVSSAGHLGGHAPGDDLAPAEVFPADPTVGVLARTDGATPVWNRDTATCAGIYCHGGGAGLAGDTAPPDQQPIWTSKGLTCGGACHGLPPGMAPHQPDMIITDCNTCHPRTVDPAGNIILAGPPGAITSAHINGAIDVAP